MFGGGYFCRDCHVSYNNKSGHRCSKTCPCCQQSPVCPNTNNIICPDCNRSFRGQSCLDRHTLHNICAQVRRCSTCQRTILKNRTHICGEIFCKVCVSHQPENHLCFIQKDVKQPIIKDLLFIFFDLETRQEKRCMDKPNSVIHEPNLCVSEQRCSLCMSIDNLYFCQKCGFRQKIIQNGNIIQQFMDYVLLAKQKFKNVIVIAHNGQAFDHQFILKYVLEHTVMKPEIIMRGTKLILLQIGNIKFIDSINYFPMALSALPKAFDLPSSSKKGYFPHLFNTITNAKYVGPLPDRAYYSADTMKVCDDCDEFCGREGCRNNFLNWHNTLNQQNYIFNFESELIAYCISDVKILTQACMKFRQIMLEECNVCPFTEGTTIASACNLVFRRNFLKPNTVAVIPKNGYRKVNNQSKSALKWLIEESERRNIHIIHAGNSKEVSINGVKVDGFCNETREIFEFHGCYYHGHECLNNKRDDPLHEDSLETLNIRRSRTQVKTDKLRSWGFQVLEMWECQFKTTISDSHPVLSCLPLNPRDAFYGGRTGNTRTYFKCNDREKIRYIDVCSLYPWVCKYGKFPVGHPNIYIGDECKQLDLKTTNGIIKCSILPPTNLYHPVLPQKMCKKLMFVLCRTCGEKFNQRKCTHNDAERTLSGTWVIDEVNKAISKGYKIITIDEIWQYDIAQMNTNVEGLFTQFIDKFVKMKQEASGWPSTCNTEEEKTKYILDYRNQEGISLVRDKIVKNAGLRSLAKLILNSFWGKFGQRENQSKVTIVRKPGVLYEYFTNPSIDINHVQEINNNTVLLNWEYVEEAFETSPIANVCIAAYTTTEARLKLYSYLERLEERVLYYDTDSVIYVSEKDQYEPPLGSFLGNMTNELEEYGPDSYISEFVSGGPKNYAYEVTTADNKKIGKCKVKGFTLNFETSKKVNLSTMKEMILGEGEQQSVSILYRNIQRTKTHEVVTATHTKTYKPQSRKRRFLSNNNSLPFGHERIKDL